MNNLDIKHFKTTCHDLSGSDSKWIEMGKSINTKFIVALYCTEKIKTILDKLQNEKLVNKYITEHIEDEGFFKCVYDKDKHILKINKMITSGIIFN